jgi:DNA invertase Pin-like site-specific DNA recombinase
MRAARERRIDVILAEDLSRISRDFADSAALFRELQYLGVRLVGVADGVDTAAPAGKLTYSLKALIGEVYLDDLRDKTLRGLRARFTQGFSPGGLPMGYSTEGATSDDFAGRRIVIVDSEATLIRRVFDLYIEGHSYDSIARLFNKKQVPPPRATTKHRNKGWVASTIRSILHNEAYIGVWTYGKRQWRKIPGTNTRRPKMREPDEVLRQNRPELRIIDDERWATVQFRLAEVKARYSRSPNLGARSGRTNYPLSGLLVCGVCGAPFVISGGSVAAYYKCGAFKKRGTCANSLAIREDVACTVIFNAIRATLESPTAMEYLRRRIAELLGGAERANTKELREREQRIERVQARIQRLVNLLADGVDSDAVRQELRDCESRKRMEQGALDALRHRAGTPIPLPSIDQLLERALDLSTVLHGDPIRARECLRRIFKDGRITLNPAPDGDYQVEATLLPLMAVGQMQKPPREPQGCSRGTGISCAGAQCSLYTAISVGFERRLVA